MHREALYSSHMAHSGCNNNKTIIQNSSFMSNENIHKKVGTSDTSVHIENKYYGFESHPSCQNALFIGQNFMYTYNVINLQK